MSIWTLELTTDLLNYRCKNTMVETLGIEFVEIGENFLKAKMPVDYRTLQPFGIMHGGASCVLAESVASVAAGCCVGPTLYCIGLEINTSHIRQAESGWVIGIAKPLHLGKTTQIWEIPVLNEQDQLISMSRLRMAVLEKRKG